MKMEEQEKLLKKYFYFLVMFLLKIKVMLQLIMLIPRLGYKLYGKVHALQICKTKGPRDYFATGNRCSSYVTVYSIILFKMLC